MNKTFYIYMIGRSMFALSGVLLAIFITLYVYEETGSILYATLFPFTQTVAGLIAGFTTTLLLQRVGFRTLFVVTSCGNMVLLLLFASVLPIMAEHIIMLLVLLFCMSLMGGWRGPLVSSVLPRVIEKEKLVKGNSIVSIVNQSIQIFGYTMGGVLFLYIGAVPVLIAIIGLLVIGLLCFLALFTRIELDEQKHKDMKWTVLLAGWKQLWTNPSLRIITTMDVLEGIAGATWMGAITLAYVTEILRKGSDWYGYINASYYIGTIIGGLFIMSMSKIIQANLMKSMMIGSFLFGIFSFIYAFNTIPLVALLLCVAMGPVYQMRDVAQSTVMQQSIDSANLPNVYAAYGVILSTVSGVSIMLMGLIVDVFGVKTVYIVCSLFFLLSACLSFLLVNRVGTKKEE